MQYMGPMVPWGLYQNSSLYRHPFGFLYVETK